MHVITKGVLIGLVCGTTVPASVLAAFQFPDFFSTQYSALGPAEFKLFGVTLTAATLRGQALLATLVVGCMGGVIGTVIGLFFGIAIARRRRSRDG
jgi:hypothetical protein